MLEVAFAGAIPARDLIHGWARLNLASPYANLAITLNLGWLAVVLYADAIVSPFGTGLVYAAALPRSLYAFRQNGYLSRALQRVNRYGAPNIGIALSFIVGVLFLLPFPSWQKMVGILSSATIIADMIGPVAAATLRRTAPDVPRPFRARGLVILAPIGFVVGGLIEYWSGWDVNWWMGVLLLVGSCSIQLGDIACSAVRVKTSDWRSGSYPISAPSRFSPGSVPAASAA